MSAKLVERTNVIKDWIHVAFPVEYQIERFEDKTEYHIFVYTIGGARCTVIGATRGEAMAKIQDSFLQLT